MSSYFTLELDTTPPYIEMSTQDTAFPDSIIQVLISSNEPLGEYQDIYLIDSAKVTHNLIFKKINSYMYEGFIDFSSVSLGISRLYARLDDTVSNLSNVALADILVAKDATFVSIFTEIVVRELDTETLGSDISIEAMVRPVDIETLGNDISVEVTTRSLDADVESIDLYVETSVNVRGDTV
jgi:hypothetical protein